MTEAGSIRLGTTTIGYQVVRSTRRRKTVAIRVDSKAGVVVLAPMSTTPRWLEEFVRERSPWIVQRLAETPPIAPRRQLITGETIPYLGREITIAAEPAAVEIARLTLGGQTMGISVPDGLDGSQRRAALVEALTSWYKLRAAEQISASVALWSAVVGETPKRVLVADQRSRWGSCAADGTLRFNWRIVMADPMLLDYVVVHELAHLKQRNHSSAFWDEVGAAMPDYKLRRVRLRESGRSFEL